MKTRFGVYPLFCLLVLVAGSIPLSSGAAIDNVSLETSLVEFFPETQQTSPQWVLSDAGEQSRNLVFRLPVLTRHDIQAQGQTWQMLEIEGAVVHGETGEPGVPVVSRLVAVPRGMKLDTSLISASSSRLSDIQLWPLQDPGAGSFAYSTTAYAQQRANTGSEPRISVGRPAIMAGQTMVPLTIEVLDYDPASKSAAVWTEVSLKLEFVADPEASLASSQPRMLPRSFASHLSKHVLGYPQADLMAGAMDGGSLGTYAAVHSGHADVMAGIAPLLKWRREQGYHVVEINTGLAGGSNSAIKAQLLAIYNDTTIPPLEFVTIFGDVGGSFPVPSWTESLSGYGGGGDHYYTTLEGDDILGDVHIGRVSVRTSTELTNVVNKILGYEQTPPMDNTEWFGRACLQGDPSASGITTIYTNQWVKGQLMELGWSHVDTTWSGNFAAEMLASVGPGSTAYGYRGYLGTSGISNGHVESLTNGLRLPVALLPTCDSGSFVSSTTSRSEAWLRAPSGGAIAAVGTATIGTHTRYNNCYYLGTWDGLLNGDDPRIGTAHSAGKLALYNGYFLAEPDRAEIWAVWNNVMGDGATEMWTGVPTVVNVTHPTQVSVGGQAVTIEVKQADFGYPIEGARVCLYQETSGFQVFGVTDASGQVILNLPDLPAGTVAVTATGHNVLPYRSGLTVGQVDVFCSASGRLLGEGDDDSLSPGEVTTITPQLTNHGSTDAFAVTAELTVLSGPVSVTGGSFNLGTILAGQEVIPATSADIAIDADARNGEVVRLMLAATDGQEVWTSLIEEPVVAAEFSVTDVNLASFGGSIDPGETGRFELVLANLGSLDAAAVTAIMTCDDPWVTITHDQGSFGAIPVGGSASNPISAFGLSVSPDCFGGTLVVLDLAITYADGKLASTQLAVTVGEASSDQPTGPDAHGYYALDNMDLGSPLAPVYNWVGIDPDHGGQGEDLGLTDFGWEQDDIKTVDLPFTFSFYGVDYDQISICSNGWLAMGETPVVFYRNFPLPAPHSAGAMIAPFWDNLEQTGNKKVYVWHDEIGHRYIIQWYEMPNHYSDAVQNFQAILLDPAHHATATGDGMILFQYERVLNTDSRDGYATVGIQNMERTQGLNYTYWNQYAPGAAPLEAGRAILFAPLGEILLPAAQVTPGSIAQSVAPDAQVTEYLHITNSGEEGSYLDFELVVEDPATVSRSKAYVDGLQGEVEPTSLNGSNVTTNITGYLAGTTMDMPFNVYCSSNDNEWLMRLEMDLPEGVTVNSATSIIPAQNGDLQWNQETGNGVLTSWGNIGGSFLSNGQTGSATVNLSFAADFDGDVIIPWQVFGDNYGAPPHEISGELVLTSLGPSVTVVAPVAGQTAILGQDLAVEFVANGGPQTVNIELQREPDGAWESLATDIAVDSSPWIWTVSGQPGPYAVIRVSDFADETVFGTSGVFPVSRNLDWVQPEAFSGEILAGQTLDLAVVLDATDLDLGIHEATLVVTSNGGAPVRVPVSLTVTGASPVGQLPQVVTLLGNHPNPFNPQTQIGFSLPADQRVKLGVYSVRGRLVRTLLQGQQPAGVHRVLWNGRDKQGQNVASGVYFYRLETEGRVLTGKMVLTK